MVPYLNENRNLVSKSRAHFHGDWLILVPSTAGRIRWQETELMSTIGVDHECDGERF